MRIVLIAALLPCVVLGYYIFRKDKVESEPSGLLVKLFLLGCLSTIPAVILESIGMYILGAIGLTGTLLVVIENFLVVGVAEEFSKRFMLRIGSWNDPAFNYLFDGVVYGVFVALGFAGRSLCMRSADCSWAISTDWRRRIPATDMRMQPERAASSAFGSLS